MTVEWKDPVQCSAEIESSNFLNIAIITFVSVCCLFLWMSLMLYSTQCQNLCSWELESRTDLSTIL